MNENIHQLSPFLKTEELAIIDTLLQAIDFDNGKSTASDAARLVKNNLQASIEGSKEKQQIDALIYHAVSTSPYVQTFLLPSRILPVIIGKYEVGMYYGSHVDSPIMGSAQTGVVRTDMAMTIFLSDPEDYAGGELCLQDGNSEIIIKMKKGDAVFYPASVLHRVAPVTSGIRLVAVSWCQCLVKNNEQRLILAKLKAVQAMLERANPTSQEHLTLLQVYSNLMKMWAEV